MNKQAVKRRDFLKSMGSLFLGVIVFPFERLLRKGSPGPAKPTPMREAMHYTVDDNLAG